MVFRLIVSDLGNLPLDYLNRLDLSYFENGRVFFFVQGCNKVHGNIRTVNEYQGCIPLNNDRVVRHF